MGSKIPTIPFVKFPPLTKTKKTVALISFSFRKLKVMSGVLEESQKNRNSILAWLGGTKSKKKAKKRETWSLFSFSATSGSDSLGLKNETEDSRLRSM